jgi:membrane-bound ClpP family serine protease
MVLVQGELWAATAGGERLETGQRVRVLKLEGLKVHVVREPQ